MYMYVSGHVILFIQATTLQHKCFDSWKYLNLLGYWKTDYIHFTNFYSYECVLFKKKCSSFHWTLKLGSRGVVHVIVIIKIVGLHSNFLVVKIVLKSVVKDQSFYEQIWCFKTGFVI